MEDSYGTNSAPLGLRAALRVTVMGVGAQWFLPACSIWAGALSGGKGSARKLSPGHMKALLRALESVTEGMKLQGLHEHLH